MTLRPLDGIRILEMGTTEVEGVATLLLSDYGAEVIRLEFPGGAFEGMPENRQGFRICDRGKTRLSFCPDNPAERRWLEDVLPRVDAVVSSVPEREMAQWELDAGTVCGRYPRMVYTSVTGYGATGPFGERPCNEASIQAESGFMSITGPEHGEPVRSGSDFATFAGAANACIGTLMALIDAQHTGKGRKVDVSMMDSVLYGLENQFSLYLKSGKVPVPMGNHYALSAPVGDFLCRDGKKLMISVATDTQWRNFAEVLGHPEWLENPDFRNVSARLKHYQSLGTAVAGAFMEYSSDELMELLQTRSCIYGRINDFEDVVGHPQAAARGMFVKVTAPDGASFTVPGNPLVLDHTKSAGTVINNTKLCLEYGTDKRNDT